MMLRLNQDLRGTHAVQDEGSIDQLLRLGLQAAALENVTTWGYRLIFACYTYYTSS